MLAPCNHKSKPPPAQRCRKLPQAAGAGIYLVSRPPPWDDSRVNRLARDALGTLAGVQVCYWRRPRSFV